VATKPPIDAGEPERTVETAQTLDRGLRLLLLVSDNPYGLTVTQAADRLGVGRAVIYRLAATLVEHGMIRRDSSGRMRLGAGVLHLAGRVQPLIAEAARPLLRKLAESIGATAHLTVADGPEAMALAVVEPSWTAFHVAYRTGARHPIGRGAAGKAILSGRTGETAWQATESELEAGAYGVAAPVLGIEGLEASVGVIALGPLDVDSVGPQVVEAASALTRVLK
jgi:DNA-binding IclR family transcriptional regulator